MAESRIAKSPRELRDEVEALIRDDLIGPLGGDQEELHEAPVDRYLLGLLAPRFALGQVSSGSGASGDEDPIEADAQPEDELAGGGITADSGEEGTAEDRPPAIDQLIPSAFGLTFAIDDECDALLVEASWGAYARHTSEEKLDWDNKPARVWRRRPCGGAKRVSIGRAGAIAPFVPDEAEPEVIVRGLVRERHGHRLVSLFLVNGQVGGGGRSVECWLCQASLSVEHPDGRPVFVRRRIDTVAMAPAIDREELAGLEMQYRASVELAVGHGVGVEVTEALDAPGRGVRLQTAAMPAEEVPRTDAPGPEDFADAAIAEPLAAAVDALDMKTLSEASDDALPGLLTPLAEAYEAWIAAQRERIADPESRLAGYEQTAREHLAGNRSWRPFQLAFVLLNLPSLADPGHQERAGRGGARRPAVLPDRRRQDRGVPRPHRVHARDPPPAGRRRRPRRARRRRRADALHAAAADAAAVPARRRADVRVRAAAPRATAAADRTAVGHDAVPDRAVGRAGARLRTAPRTPITGSSRRGSAAAARLLADAARALPLVRLGAAGWPRHRDRRGAAADPPLLRRPARGSARSPRATARARGCRSWSSTRRSTGCCRRW